MARTTALYRPTWAALAPAALGGLFALSLTQETVAAGGVALLAGALVVGLLLGLPVAWVASRTPVDGQRPLGALQTGLTEVWATLAVAAVAGPVVASLGLTGLILASLAWLATAFAGSLRRTGAVVLAGLTLLVGIALVAVSTSFGGPAWTLLEARFSPTSPWLGPALLAGLLLGGGGLVGVRVPGRRPRGTAVMVGTGLLALLVVLLRIAVPYEAGVLSGAVDPLWLLFAAVLVPAAILGLAPHGVPDAARRPAGLAAVGLVATALFAGPAADALPLWWQALLPLGLAASLGLRLATAWKRLPWLDRCVLGLGAATAVVIPVATAPDLPGALAAGLLGLAPVAAVWIAGSRALRVHIRSQA